MDVDLLMGLGAFCLTVGGILWRFSSQVSKLEVKVARLEEEAKSCRDWQGDRDRRLVTLEAHSTRAHG